MASDLTMAIAANGAYAPFKGQSVVRAGSLLATVSALGLPEEESDDAVVAFAGSQDAKDWAVNLDWPMRRLMGGAAVHEGFLSGVEAAMPELCDLLRSMRPRRVHLTGHSKGAAEATVAAALMPADLLVGRLATFGSPRVGNAAFADLVTIRTESVDRFVAESDPVPWTPPALVGFRHVGRLRWHDGSHWRDGMPAWRVAATWLFGRRWPFVGDAFGDHAMSNYLRKMRPVNIITDDWDEDDEDLGDDPEELGWLN